MQNLDKTVWGYMRDKGLDADHLVSKVTSRNDAIEYGWELAKEYIKDEQAIEEAGEHL